MKDNAIKKGVIYFLVDQLVPFRICLNHKVKPKEYNARVPPHFVGSLRKELSTASWSGNLQIFMLQITKKCIQTKNNENKHTYYMFQPMFTTWADHQTVSLTLAFATQSELCQCTRKRQKDT